MKVAEWGHSQVCLTPKLVFSLFILFNILGDIHVEQ